MDLDPASWGGLELGLKILPVKISSAVIHLPQTKKQDIKVFYRSTMTSAWKIEEQVIRSIVRRNCKTTDDEKHLKIHIYYKSPKTSSLVMQNNLLRNTATLKQTNVTSIPVSM